MKQIDRRHRDREARVGEVEGEIDTARLTV